jgi:hypothetical protein
MISVNTMYLAYNSLFHQNQITTKKKVRYREEGGMVKGKWGWGKKVQPISHPMVD